MSLTIAIPAFHYFQARRRILYNLILEHHQPYPTKYLESLEHAIMERIAFFLLSWNLQLTIFQI